jgi:hypothetical protein
MRSEIEGQQCAPKGAGAEPLLSFVLLVDWA